MPQPNRETNQIIETIVERIVPDGYGIAFADGLTIFVPLAAPGDRVRVRINTRKGRTAFASIIEILEPSPARVEPPCPYFGLCGGCDFQQLDYAAQLTAKVGIIRDCLRRIGKINREAEIPIVPSPEQWNYRTRAGWKHDSPTETLGYYERSSHRICDVTTCPILTLPLQAALEETREQMQNGKLDAVKEIHAVNGGETVSRLEVKNSQNATGGDENFYAANKQAIDAAENAGDSLQAAISANSKTVHLQIGEFAYEFDAATFFQVNHNILPKFIETVIGGETGEFALDLYCGVGLFSLPLSKNFKRVIGLEGNTRSIEFARRNAANAGVNDVEFETAAVGRWLADNRETLQAVDFVLLDPPRTGLERAAVSALAEAAPPRVVYVSCNPATLARDLQILSAGNYKLENIIAFDFFPQTHHVETVVTLNR